MSEYVRKKFLEVAMSDLYSSICITSVNASALDNAGIEIPDGIGKANPVISALREKKIGNPKLAGFIAAIVCSNLIVWLFEKLVSWEYEFLSVTYIASELLLLVVYWMMQDYVHKNEVPEPMIMEKPTVIVVNSISKAEKINRLLTALPKDKTLTAKEIEILGELVEGKTRKDIAAEHHITENTVKTHVTHIYEKFGVSSKDALSALVHTSETQ